MNDITLSTPLRDRQAERRAESDARMLEATIDLICERGTAGTTVREVGVRAGYSRGLASERFGTKAALLSHVVRAVGEEWLAELQAATEGKEGLAAVDAALDAHLHFLLDAPRHVRAFYILWFEAIGPSSEVRPVIQRIESRRQRDVEQWLKSGVEAGSLPATLDIQRTARGFCIAVTGIAYHWLLYPEDQAGVIELHQDLKRNVRLWIHGSDRLPRD